LENGSIAIGCSVFIITSTLLLKLRGERRRYFTSGNTAGTGIETGTMAKGCPLYPKYVFTSSRAVFYTDIFKNAN
jgi:hypothetical protein